MADEDEILRFAQDDTVKQLSGCVSPPLYRPGGTHYLSEVIC